jgi:Domain of unknown function (DUF5615)
MARLYSNENFAADFVLILRALGHDVLTTSQAGQANQGIPDDEVLTFATANDLIVITFNRNDFIELHRSAHHAGIIVCKADLDYEGQAKVLQEWLLDNVDLHNRCLRVQKQNQGKLGQVFIVKEYGK